MISKSLRVWCSGLTLLASLAAGCQSQNGGRREFAWWTTTRKDTDNAKLKEPEQTHLAYAQWQEQTGKLAEARESYKKALGLNPKSAEAIVGLARLDEMAGRSREAEEGFQKALKLKPNDPNILVAVGQFYGSRKQWNKAVELLNKATTAAPENTRARYHLAVALARSGNTEAAMPHFVKTVGEASAHYNVGYILYEQGKLADAETHLAIALAQKPDMQQAHAVLQKIRGAHGGQSLLAKRAAGVVHPSGLNTDTDRFFQPNSAGAEYRIADSGEPLATVQPRVAVSRTDEIPNWAVQPQQRVPRPAHHVAQRPAGLATTADLTVQAPAGRASAPAMNRQPSHAARAANTHFADQAAASTAPTIDAPAPVELMEPLDVTDLADLPLESGAGNSAQPQWRPNPPEGRANLSRQNTFFDGAATQRDTSGTHGDPESDFEQPVNPQWQNWQAAPNSTGAGDEWQANPSAGAAGGTSGWSSTSDVNRRQIPQRGVDEWQNVPR